jgi:hypothetical protein
MMLSITKFRIMMLIIMTPSITTLNITLLKIAALSITTLIMMLAKKDRAYPRGALLGTLNFNYKYETRVKDNKDNKDNNKHSSLSHDIIIWIYG